MGKGSGKERVWQSYRCVSMSPHCDFLSYDPVPSRLGGTGWLEEAGDYSIGSEEIQCELLKEKIGPSWTVRTLSRSWDYDCSPLGSLDLSILAVCSWTWLYLANPAITNPPHSPHSPPHTQTNVCIRANTYTSPWFCSSGQTLTDILYIHFSGFCANTFYGHDIKQFPRLITKNLTHTCHRD